MEKLIVNGQTFTSAELKTFCQDRMMHVPQWEKEHLTFIHQWLNGETQFEVSTSGSTGVPKKIFHSRISMEASARLTAEFLSLKKSASALLCLPSAFIAGKMMIVRALLNSWSLTWTEPDSRPLQNTTEPFDFVAMTPMQVESSMRNDKEKLGQIGTLIIGGAAIHPELEKQLQELDNRIFATYGMTETITHIAMRKVNGFDRSEKFRALPGVHFSTDERQCLKILAPHVQPEWLVTNDIVELEGDNSFRYLGRWDNVINSGGIKIFAEELEKKIAPCLDVPFFILKKEDIALGEKVVLYIEMHEVPADFKLNLMQILKSNLKSYEVPKEVILVDQFEYTATQKIVRKQY